MNDYNNCSRIKDKDKVIYAVKTLLYSFADEDVVRSFKNEIVLSSRIEGENVIRYAYA